MKEGNQEPLQIIHDYFKSSGLILFTTVKAWHEHWHCKVQEKKDKMKDFRDLVSETGDHLEQCFGTVWPLSTIRVWTLGFVLLRFELILNMQDAMGPELNLLRFMDLFYAHLTSSHINICSHYKDLSSLKYFCSWQILKVFLYLAFWQQDLFSEKSKLKGCNE